ncbi:hypothetical protein C8Q75DRAFT_493088 [Abortiporus biennis]|nr:hypothetical protein C8Q75DRAFT_493088 [Abortiporus biennis]
MKLLVFCSFLALLVMSMLFGKEKSRRRFLPYTRGSYSTSRSRFQPELNLSVVGPTLYDITSRSCSTFHNYTLYPPYYHHTLCYPYYNYTLSSPYYDQFHPSSRLLKHWSSATFEQCD